MKKVILSVFMLFAMVPAVFAEAEVKNELLLERGKESYQQVRYIVAKGTNEEIGKALADIARKDYGV